MRRKVVGSAYAPDGKVALTFNDGIEVLIKEPEDGTILVGVDLEALNRWVEQRYGMFL